MVAWLVHLSIDFDIFVILSAVVSRTDLLGLVFVDLDVVDLLRRPRVIVFNQGLFELVQILLGVQLFQGMVDY